MRKRRKFYRGVVNHVYQRTIDGVHLFYTREDCLVFFTILSVCAKSAEVQILELCLMHNHIHMIIKSETVQELSGFMDHFLSWFVHANCSRKILVVHRNGKKRDCEVRLFMWGIILLRNISVQGHWSTDGISLLIEILQTLFLRKLSKVSSLLR